MTESTGAAAVVAVAGSCWRGINFALALLLMQQPGSGLPGAPGAPAVLALPAAASRLGAAGGRGPTGGQAGAAAAQAPIGMHIEQRSECPNWPFSLRYLMWRTH